MILKNGVSGLLKAGTISKNISVGRPAKGYWHKYMEMENNKSRQETVAAITVTYNRTRTLEKCIDALLNQTRPVDHIIIADNHSCEEEQEKIRKIAAKSHKIKLLFLDENRGGAGGFEAGMREAKKLSPDWYWLMDDDAYPRKDCLETLLDTGKELPDAGGLCPLIYGIDLKHYQLFHHKKLSRFMMKNSPVVRDADQLKAVTEEDANAFIKEAQGDDKVYIVVEEDREQYFGEPPTKLENPKLFKPFEMFIKMYGLPKSGEMDPTIFVGIMYSFIFGAMFGDVGQGLLLFIGGAILYFTKKMNLAGIVSLAGIFSTFFGFMFGSVFGFEDIIEAKWIRPINHMTTLPFIGKLNTVFIVSIAFGMGIILISMIFHILNGIRAKDTEATWFDANGVAGLIFYGAAVTCIVLFMTGHSLPGGIVLAVMFGVPLLLIALKEPLTNKIKKKTEKMEQSKAMFVTQAFFELFETLLSYFSNTLSFIRIGAFAVSHASIMEVVLMLAGAESGHINWVVIVLGNLFVCGFEGLIVGIQVLRLVYYEMFSRFYKGSGREFKPYTGTAKN